MCGRFVVADAAQQLVGVLNVDVAGADLPGPSFNIAPTARVAIVLDSLKTDPPTRRLEVARWGLVPAWATDPSVGARAFNARSETVAEKPTFRDALVARRAVVPASGYYEWRGAGEQKIPYYIHPADGAPLFLAGLYEWWRDRSRAADDPARWMLSFTILTRRATGALAEIHERMPVFLDADVADAWLDAETDNVGDLLEGAVDAASALAEELTLSPVGPAVGNVRDDSPELILPVDG